MTGGGCAAREGSASDSRLGACGFSSPGEEWDVFRPGMPASAGMRRFGGIGQDRSAGAGKFRGSAVPEIDRRLCAGQPWCSRLPDASARNSRWSQKEDLLAAAGFQVRPADSPHRVAALKLLPPNKFVREDPRRQPDLSLCRPARLQLPLLRDPAELGRVQAGDVC